MCTSVLLMYGSIGSGGGGGSSADNDGTGGRRALKEQVQQQQKQQQVAATTPFQKPESQRRLGTASPPPFPGLADRLLEGYISVLDHKVSAKKRSAAEGGARRVIDV